MAEPGLSYDQVDLLTIKEDSSVQRNEGGLLVCVYKYIIIRVSLSDRYKEERRKREKQSWSIEFAAVVFSLHASSAKGSSNTEQNLPLHLWQADSSLILSSWNDARRRCRRIK